MFRPFVRIIYNETTVEHQRKSTIEELEKIKEESSEKKWVEILNA